MPNPHGLRALTLALALGALSACGARTSGEDPEVEALHDSVAAQESLDGRWTLRLVSAGQQGLRMGLSFGSANADGRFTVEPEFIFSGNVGLDHSEFRGGGRMTDGGLVSLVLWRTVDPDVPELRAGGTLQGNEIHLEYLYWGSTNLVWGTREWRLVRANRGSASVIRRACALSARAHAGRIGILFDTGQRPRFAGHPTDVHVKPVRRLGRG
jgi:hypothetical protein